MSFSRLLKKLSQPRLAHRTLDDDSERSLSFDDSKKPPPKPQRQISEPVPMIPYPWRRKTVSTYDRAGSSSTLSISLKAKTPIPDVLIHERPLPMLPPAAGPDINPPMELCIEVMQPEDPGSKPFSDAPNSVKDEPKESNMVYKLEIDDENNTVTAIQDEVAIFTPLVEAAFGALEQSDTGRAIKEGIDQFLEGMPIFMHALDEVAALHPFIGVAVLAFKTIYTLEMKRRDNDKKIIALHAEIKDMMDVLLLLHDVPAESDKLVGPDGRNVADRLSPLVEQTAEDIKSCSNICDTYSKKKLLAKVFQGPLWDAKLLGYVRLFSKRRQDFEFELSIHTGRGVKEANVKLNTIDDQTKVLDKKMDAMMTLFQRLVSPEQKQLMELVDAKGGVKLLQNDDKMLLELDETANKVSSAPNAKGRRAQRGKPTDTNRNADDLRDDIFEEPDAAVEKNRIVFFRKFEVQRRQIVDELSLVITRESDRVIQEVKGGPHERILDRSIHEIWSEMGWRGNVKARHFVLALRDHYLEKHASEAPTVRGLRISPANSSQNPDAWAIKYLDVSWLQPIMEAFDDDASGFITIAEMNNFTRSRPENWSLPQWVAFWGVGYRSSIIDYANKIENLFARMEGVRAKVLPPNRESIDDYFTYAWKPVHTLTAATLQLQPGPSHPEKFESYLEAEEVRLGNNLKAVEYVIDGTDTLTLITGGGRIEKIVFPLLYLLVSRHYEIMQVMQKKILDWRELWHSMESIFFVIGAIRDRVGDLVNIFSQQKLDPERHFQTFAYGIFQYFYNEKALWSVDYVRSLNPLVIPYNGADEDQNVKLEDTLNHECKDEMEINYWVYDGHSTQDISSSRDVQSPLKDILGHWHGYFYERDGNRETSGTETMMTFAIEPANGEHDFKADAWSNRGRYSITGSWEKKEVMQVKFKMSFPDEFWAAVFFNGHFNPDRDALTGVWGSSADLDISTGQMEFRRIQPWYLTVYPSIKELSDNKARALWKFAITAVRNDIRRDRWSWSYFSQRRDDRETVINLTVRYLYFGTPPNDEEIQRLCTAAQRLTPADACFYRSQINRIRANTWVHENAWCDSCGGCIGGARLFCLDCANKNTAVHNPLDLCSAPQCVTARVTHRKDLEDAHEPYHKLVKVRTVVLTRQHGRAHAAACAAFDRVGDICKRIAECSTQTQEGNEGEVDAANTNISSVRDTPHSPQESTPQDATEPPEPSLQKQDCDLPTCGNCKGSLSFPFWYCIFCQDDLYICDACDAEGVPDLMRCSGKHTEDHHLVRCLAPQEDGDITSSTERRLISLEDRLDDMHVRFDDLGDRIRNIEQLLHKLAGTDRIGSPD